MIAALHEAESRWLQRRFCLGSVSQDSLPALLRPGPYSQYTIVQVLAFLNFWGGHGGPLVASGPSPVPPLPAAGPRSSSSFSASSCERC